MTENAADEKTASAPAAKTSPYSWYVLGALTLVYTFNFVDRQIIAIVSPAIKEELGLSDSMLGLLKGLAFAILYTALGLPIAWLADRFNRVSIISVSLFVWSGFTALSGMAGSALQLALARVGVGVGEAGGSPPSHSLIADYFPKEKRSTALSIYSLGIPFGQMFAFLGGGWVLQNLGWRNAFFLVGLPGLLLAILVKLTVKEPPRGAQEAAKAADIPFTEGLKALLAIPSYWGMMIGATAASFTGYGIAMWAVDFYYRVHGLTFPEITVPLGLLNGVVYGIGTFLGGYLADRFSKRSVAAHALVPAIAVFLTIPFGGLSLIASTPFWAFAWTGVFLIFNGMYLGPTWAIIQTLSPVRMRAFAVAVFFFVLNIIALGLAPLWVGALSDYFAPSHGEAAGLRMALASLIISSLISAAGYYWTARKLPADWAKATAAPEQ